MRYCQWVIPALTDAAIVLGALQGEQQMRQNGFCARMEWTTLQPDFFMDTLAMAVVGAPATNPCRVAARNRPSKALAGVS